MPSVTCAFKKPKAGNIALCRLCQASRGMFARWMLQAKPKSTEDLKAFNVDGYSFVPSASDESTLVFRRPQPRPRKHSRPSVERLQPLFAGLGAAWWSHGRDAGVPGQVPCFNPLLARFRWTFQHGVNHCPPIVEGQLLP